MKSLKIIIAFAIATLGINGCANNMENFNKDIENVGFITGFVEENGAFHTFSVNNQGLENRLEWKEFIDNAKKVTIEIDLLKIIYYFDNSLRNCPSVKNTTPEKLKAFVPKSPKITKYKNHSVNVLLVNDKKFNWNFPYNEKESFFAFPVSNCTNGLPNSVYESTAEAYHELFHVYNHGKYSDPLKEEEQAYAIELCSLLTSKSAKSPKISYLSKGMNVDQIINSEFPNFKSLSDTTKNSIISKYTVLNELYKGNQKSGSYKSACKSIYGL
ncbi:hypothetical protein [Idiomarina abyssalis]|uniref:hypothetical protein n=1 Tax=Idiomarina abyssalis TaxID=86102 RepID=UPI003A8D12F9